MSAKIVPFTKKSSKNRKIQSAEDGVELDFPTSDDIKGFVNVLNFLAQQSATGSIVVDVLDDQIDIKIQHHDHDNFIDDQNGVSSVTNFEIMAACEFNPSDLKKQIADLLIVFDRLDLDHYQPEEDQNVK